MSMAAYMNRYEPCITCGAPVLNGMPCNHDWMTVPSPADVPPTIPMPQSRSHAEMMLLVAERYLADNPAA